MSIYAALQHRATVRRSTTTFVDGSPVRVWKTIAEDVPVLLDAAKAEEGERLPDKRADRVGFLQAGPHADITAGDALTITRGPLGTFSVKGDPADRWGLHGLSHREFAVVEVAK